MFFIISFLSYFCIYSSEIKSTCFLSSFLTALLLISLVYSILFFQWTASLCSFDFYIFWMAATVLTYRFQLYLTGSIYSCSISKVVSYMSSLLWIFLYALVHFIFLGLCFALKCTWHLDRQNLNIWQSFLIKEIPWPG